MLNKIIKLPNGYTAGPSIHIDLHTGVLKDENYQYYAESDTPVKQQTKQFLDVLDHCILSGIPLNQSN